MKAQRAYLETKNGFKHFPGAGETVKSKRVNYEGSFEGDTEGYAVQGSLTFGSQI